MSIRRNDDDRKPLAWQSKDEKPKPPDEMDKLEVDPPKKQGFFQRIAKAKVGDDGDFKGKLKKFVILYGAACTLALSIAGLKDAVTINRIDPDYEQTTVFTAAVENDEIFGVYLSEDESKIYYQYKKDVDEELLSKDVNKLDIMKLDVDSWNYTNYTSFDNLKELLYKNGLVPIRNKFNSALDATFALLISLSTTVAMVYFMYMMISMLVKQMNINAKKYEINKSSDIRFSDVIGHDEVIGDIKQYISLLRKNDSLKDLHVKTPKGILFTGRPGTGKTLLAKAMAGEAGVPFIYLNTSNVIEMYVGVGAKTIRECFKKARELAPCVVFLDEIDAIGGGRGSNKVGSSEDTQTLLALLQEMDGFSGSDGILIIAATNCPDTLDEALRRSGRFDREIIISAPRNTAIRLQMLEHYTKHYKLDSDVNLSEFAKQCVDMTGADIANICNEAAVINIMENNGELRTIHMQNMVDAYDKILLKGNKVNDKNRVNQRDRKIVAYHESGHAVMNYLKGEPISRMSIQGTTSGVGGFVMRGDKGSQFMACRDIRNGILTAYAGRASEIIKFGEEDATTGATNDIEQATDAINMMFLKAGFDRNLGMLNYEKLLKLNLVDKDTVLTAMRTEAAQRMDEAMSLLTDNYYLVEGLTAKILEEEIMSGEDVTTFLDKQRKAHGEEPIAVYESQV